MTNSNNAQDHNAQDQFVPHSSVVDNTFEKIDFKVSDIQATVEVSDKGKMTLEDTIHIDGQKMVASDRFWNSLFSRYSFGKNVFRYFRPDEVLERIVEVKGDESISCMIQENGGKQKALAISSNVKNIPKFEQYLDVINRSGSLIGSPVYDGGILSARFNPVGEGPSTIMDSRFDCQYSIDIPIDGYGNASAFLGLIRQVCANGMIAMSKAFQNMIMPGKEGNLDAIERVVGGYGNDEGFSALRSRIASSATSKASVGEIIGLKKKVTKALSSEENRDAVVEILHNINRTAGNFIDMYGIVSENQISKKRLSGLPSKCTVYDAINMATELATHNCPNIAGQRILQAWAGDTLCSEYDLEGTAKDTTTSFADRFFLAS